MRHAGCRDRLRTGGNCNLVHEHWRSKLLRRTVKGMDLYDDAEAIIEWSQTQSDMRSAERRRRPERPEAVMPWLGRILCE